MANLSIYNSIEEKRAKFENYKLIENNRSLQASIFSTDFVYEDELIFRGLNEAKYKLYNSLQRFWKLNDLDKAELDYNQFIENQINAVKGWNNKTIQSWFKRLGINNNNSLAYLSFMQHMGLPTPMLDFTYDVFKGLFFASSGVKIRYSDNELDNYFSLYAINKKTAVFSMLEIVMGNLKNHDKSDTLVNSSIPYDIFNNLKVAIAVDESILSETGRINNNLNIVNQEGLFIFNNVEELPLEDQEYELKDSIHILSKDIHCYDIHKSLRDVLKKWLNSKKINNDYMYPNLRNMKSEIQYKVLSELPVR